ncbi:hypothetical protein D3C80_1357630 [compost metagenome]
MLGGLGAVALDKVLTLKRHAVLNGNTAAQRPYPFDVLRADGLGVIKEPGQSVERNVTVDLLEHIEHPRNRLIVGGMQAKRPALLHQMAHHRFQITFHAAW